MNRDGPISDIVRAYRKVGVWLGAWALREREKTDRPVPRDPFPPGDGPMPFRD